MLINTPICIILTVAILYVCVCIYHNLAIPLVLNITSVKIIFGHLQWEH